MKEKTLTTAIAIVSIVVLALVTFLIFVPQTGSLGDLNVRNLPFLNAWLNGTCSLLLILGYIFIKKQNMKAHKICMISTFILSSIFLISYVIYHTQAPPTKFGGVGTIRIIYFVILLSHIVLAAAIVPLALLSISRGLRQEFDKHKRISKWTLPIWLFVTISGVVVYLMISPYYSH